jgi:pectinesterase
MKNKVIPALLTILLAILSQTKADSKDKYNVIVAKDGSGNFKSVQAAIDAAPTGQTVPYKIFVKAGKYVEQVIIPAGKTFIELVGEDPQTTVISFGDGKGGTSTFTINANDCMLMNITLENSQGRISDGPQSLAIRTNANHAVFFNCRFISGQDTILVSNAGSAIYFKNCYIDGNTDFVFGAATAVFDNCVIYCRDRVDGNKGGYFTAASTPTGQAYGLVFRDCIIPNNHGVTVYTLGRPWQNDAGTAINGRKRASNNVVFLNTKMSNSISPAGWSAWDKGTVTDVITYAEYKTRKFDGSLTDISQRVPWSKQLTDEQAAPYLINSNLFGQWDPFPVWVDMPRTANSSSIAISNFLARTDGSQAAFQFNSSWPIEGVTYDLYKKAGDASQFKKIGSLTTKSDTTVAYQFKDGIPDQDQTSYYLLKAQKNKSIYWSDTLQVTATTLLKAKRK